MNRSRCSSAHGRSRTWTQKGPDAKANATGSDYIRLPVPYVRDAVFDSEGKCAVAVAVRNAIGVISDTAPFTIER
jgi:hypothetical protein